MLEFIYSNNNNNIPLKYSSSNSSNTRKLLDRQLTLYGGDDDEENDIDIDDYNNSLYDDMCDGVASAVNEDRQWDSGGGRHTSLGKVLPKIPIRASNSVNDGFYYR